MPTTTPILTFRRADDRGLTDIGWLKSRHSFSFGQYHDPNRMDFAGLRVINEDWIQPGTGFPEHPHRDMEILTWVLSGSVRHGDSLENSQLLKPGDLQAMSAGSGIRHSEFNGSDSDVLHLLQIWITPATRGIEPRYLQKTFDATHRLNQWHAIASGRKGITPDATNTTDPHGLTDRHAPLPIHQDATLWVADLQPAAAEREKGLPIALEPGRRAYIHLATGQATLTTGDEGIELRAGDAVSTDSPAGATDAQSAITVGAADQAQVLWFDLP